MHTEIVKWGNSLGLRIPKKLAERYGIEAGTEIEFGLKKEGLVIIPAKKNDGKYSLAELLLQVTPENKHDYISSGNAVGKEEF